VSTQSSLMETGRQRPRGGRDTTLHLRPATTLWNYDGVVVAFDTPLGALLRSAATSSTLNCSPRTAVRPSLRHRRDAPIVNNERQGRGSPHSQEGDELPNPIVEVRIRSQPSAANLPALSSIIRRRSPGFESALARDSVRISNSTNSRERSECLPRWLPDDHARLPGHTQGGMAAAIRLAA
jgi:hypothetical protein